MTDKLYEVTSASFVDLTLEAIETDLSIDDVPESEIWNIADLREFQVRLVNRGSVAKIIDIAEWMRTVRGTVSK